MRGSRLPVGLVGDQQQGLGDDGARDADALLLAARQHQRQQALLAEQSHRIQRGAHAPADGVVRKAADHQRSATLVVHRAVVQQVSSGR